MASRVTQPVKGYHKDPKVVFLRFFPQSTSAPTVNADQSRGVASVSRTGVGTFLVTFDDAYQECVNMTGTVQSSTVGDFDVVMGDLSNVGTSTAATVVVNIRDQQASGNVDMSADANNSVSCMFVFNDSATY